MIFNVSGVRNFGPCREFESWIIQLIY